MLLTDIENELIARLKSKIGNALKIEGFPDNPNTYKLIHPVGAILVHYTGSSFSTSQATDYIVQDKITNFDIYVACKSLRLNKKGVEQFIDKVNSALLGFKLSASKKIYPTKETYVSEDNGLWSYSVSYSIPHIAIEDVEDEDKPTLKTATLVKVPYGTYEKQNS